MCGLFTKYMLKTILDRDNQNIYFIEFLEILQGLFPPGQGATIGVDFMIKTVEVENEKVKVCN